MSVQANVCMVGVGIGMSLVFTVAVKHMEVRLCMGSIEMLANMRVMK